MTSTPQTIEQRVAHLEAEIARISTLLPPRQPSSTAELDNNALPFGAFENDPYFDEILQHLRQERELDDDNPAYT